VRVSQLPVLYLEFAERIGLELFGVGSAGFEPMRRVLVLVSGFEERCWGMETYLSNTMMAVMMYYDYVETFNRMKE
jgi:hypothetical protein